MTTTNEIPAFQWPEGKCCAISLTFDDARLSQIDTGMEILDRYGVKGTFYVSFDMLEKRMDGWRAAVANGHEIGNHTVTHPCTGNFVWSRRRALEDYTLKQMDAEMVEANAMIEDRLGVTPTTFAYPCGQTNIGRGLDLRSYIPVVAQHFVAGRGFRNETTSDPAFCDLAYVGGLEFDGMTPEAAIGMAKRVAAEGFWAPLAGHEIGDPGGQTVPSETLEALCAYVTDPANGIWCDTAAAVAAYIQGHRQAP